MTSSPARAVTDRGDRVDVSRVYGILRAARLVWPMALVAATLAAALALFVLHWARPEWAGPRLYSLRCWCPEAWAPC
jgi:hypothetical protein